MCIFFVTYEHPLYRFIFLHRGRFVYCPFLLVRSILHAGRYFCKEHIVFGKVCEPLTDFRVRPLYGGIDTTIFTDRGHCHKIIGHSQFEKIPMSVERQQAILERQIEEILEGIEQAKAQKAERYTVKQMERTRKSLETRLAKLNDQSRKDDVVTFEQLGTDRIFIDESHYFKNCAKRCA